MASKVEEVLAQAKPWLKEAHNHSEGPWATGIVDLDTLLPMRIDEAESGYQRPLSDARVDDLYEKFDAGEARDIWVSERADGSRWILDGQHTWAVLRRMGFTQWPARIFYGLSIAEEARRFAEYQNNTRRIPSVVQFNAEVIAKDPTAVALDKILTDYYLRISSSKLRHKDNYLGVTSRAVFQKIYELGGEYTLREVLQLAIDAWGQAGTSFLGRVLQGMGYLFTYCEGQFDRGRFLAVMRNTTPKQLVEAIGPTGSGGASRAGSLLLLEKYLEGTHSYPKIRHNAKDAPRLPDVAPKEGPMSKDPSRDGEGLWVEGTENEGRIHVGPMVKPEKPQAPVEINIEQAKLNEAEEAAEGDQGGLKGLEDHMDLDALDTAEEAAEVFEAALESGSRQEEPDEEEWEYPSPDAD